MPEYSTVERLRRAPGYGLKLARRWVARRYWQFRLPPDHHALNGGAALAAATDAESVTFLCWGNVCRSPFAERYLAAELVERGRDGVTVASAGLGSRSDRPSPPGAVAAAAEHGVDLSDHRSSCPPDRLADSDLVFVMDYNNYGSVATRFADAGPVFFLGALAPGNTAAVPDPYGEDEAAFETVYGTIAAAVDRLADALADGAT